MWRLAKSNPKLLCPGDRHTKPWFKNRTGEDPVKPLVYRSDRRLSRFDGNKKSVHLLMFKLFFKGSAFTYIMCTSTKSQKKRTQLYWACGIFCVVLVEVPGSIKKPARPAVPVFLVELRVRYGFYLELNIFLDENSRELVNPSLNRKLEVDFHARKKNPTNSAHLPYLSSASSVSRQSSTSFYQRQWRNGR